MKKVNVFLDQRTGNYSLKFNAGKGEIVEEHNFESMDDEVCELILVKQNEKYYLFGATPNSNWFGFKVDLERYNSYKNKFNLFNNLWL